MPPALDHGLGLDHTYLGEDRAEEISPVVYDTEAMPGLRQITEDFPVPDFLSGLAAPLANRLIAYMRSAAKGAVPEKTISGLISDGRLFASWCRTNDRAWLPASPDSVVEFVETMTASRRPNTIQRYLASVGKLHEIAGLPTPTSDPLVRLARRAERGTKGSQAKPVNIGLVERLAGMLTDEAETSDGDQRLAALRDRALIMVAHDSLARPAEIVALRRDGGDLLVDGEGDGQILIRRAKNDQEGKGSWRWIDRTTVAALRDWFEAEAAALAERREGEADRHAARARRLDNKGTGRGRKRIHPIVEPVTFEWTETPYLFRGLAHTYEFERGRDTLGKRTKGPRTRVLGWSEHLSTSSLGRVLRGRLVEAGIEPDGYSGHSTRVGKTQDLLAEGYSLLQVMNAGGWASPHMPARYGENILAAQGAVAQAAKQRRLRSANSRAVTNGSSTGEGGV